MIYSGTLSLKDLSVPHESVYAAMGYGEAVPEDFVRDLTDAVLADALQLARPQYMYKIVDASVVDKYRILMDGAEFRTGSIIGSYLDGMTKACVFVTSAGVEYDAYLGRVKREDNILKEFVADAVGSCIAEACVDVIDRQLPRPHSLPYSPGYCAWNIKEQRLLFPLLPDEPCGVTLGESCLMHPVKSVSGFFALGEKLVPQPYRCDLCTNKNCYKKRHK
mgnify:CR=1 FL=1